MFYHVRIISFPSHGILYLHLARHYFITYLLTKSYTLSSVVTEILCVCAWSNFNNSSGFYLNRLYVLPASCWRVRYAVWRETRRGRRAWPTWSIWRTSCCSSSSCDLAARGRRFCPSSTQCCSSVQKRRANWLPLHKVLFDWNVLLCDSLQNFCSVPKYC